MSLTFLGPIADAGPARLPLPSTDPRLSSRAREILALAPTRTYAAIAADLGVSRGTVAGVIHRARKPRPIRGFRRIAHDNIVEGLARRPSLYVTHPDILP